MSNLVHIDRVTKTPIEYTEDSYFSIYIRCQSRKKRLVRTYHSKDIELALKDYYDLEVSKYYRKHFVVETRDQINSTNGRMIFNMKGFLPHHKGLKLVGKKENYKNYNKRSSLHLTSCPNTLADKIISMPLKDYPIIDENWTKNKVVYALISYFLELPVHEQVTILRKGYRLYMYEKVKSGGELIESEEFKKVVLKANEQEDML